jgi:ribose transport system ATP-binding protein
MHDVNPAVLVRAEGISKAFGPVQALSDVTVELRAGTVHAIVGHNGAGKSTLMNVLSGVIAPDTGRLLLDGQPVHFRDPLDAARQGVSMVHQELSVLPDLTVAENLAAGMEPMGRLGLLRRREMDRRARELLAALDLTIPVGTLCADLPVGQRQLVEIARAMSTDARIVILDEPTSALTLPEQEQLFTFIRRLTGRGLGVLYVSHRLNEVMEIADAITVLRDGRVVAERQTVGLRRDELVELMVGHALTASEATVAPAPGGEMALEVSGLAADSGRLHDVTFSARTGEIVGIAGILGSGRTELFETLFGIRPLEAGTIRLHGRELNPRTPRDAIDAGVGMVPEDRRRLGILPGLALWKNLAVASLHDLFGERGVLLRERAARDATRREVQRLSIATPSVDTQIQNLSGGNQQKVILGRWLAREPRLLLLDEPTAGIDIGAKTEVHAIVRSLAEAGATVLVCSSEFPELLEMSHRILVLFGGTIVAEVDPSATTEAGLVHLATGSPEVKAA